MNVTDYYNNNFQQSYHLSVRRNAIQEIWEGDLPEQTSIQDLLDIRVQRHSSH
jgi:hypothetical protein